MIPFYGKSGRQLVQLQKNEKRQVLTPFWSFGSNPLSINFATIEIGAFIEQALANKQSPHFAYGFLQLFIDVCIC